METSTQQAWKQFWDVTAEGTNPLGAIDIPEISPQAYEAANIRINQLLTLSACDTVLNIGCGPGLFEERFATVVKNIVGVDFAHTMVDKARHRNSAVGNAYFFQASGTALPFKEGQFTKVLCYGVVHYFSEAEVIQLLTEIRRVASKGALVLLGDVEDVTESAEASSLIGKTASWTTGEIGRLVHRGTKRVRSELMRRVARLKRKWKSFTGQYVFVPKPHHLFNYSRNLILDLTTAVGYEGQIVEQEAERFAPGRYHVVLRVPE